MQCPNCQRDNEPASRFCIFCGTPLLAPEAESTAEGAADSPSEEVAALRDEVRQLRELVVRMNERLAALERTGEAAVPPPEVVPARSKAPTPTPQAVPVVTRREGAFAEVRPSPPKVREREWEQVLGGNWLARIGVLALIIGIAFLLKFAYDNDWLGAVAWGVIGIVISLAMLGVGYYWRGRYPVLAQAISGGGIAVLYLSVYAASVMFDAIAFYPSVVLLLAISIGSAVLAVWYNSMALAILGILGAFGAPFVLGGYGVIAPAEAEVGQGFWLLAYVMAIDLGVLALSAFRGWRWFTLLALTGSLAVFGLWHGRFDYEATLLTAQGSLTIIFVIFAGATTLYHLVWRRAPQPFDYALMVINAGFYLGISLGIMWDDLRAWVGGFCLLLAIFYGGLAWVAVKRSAENIRLGYFGLSIALLCLTVAIPVQFGDKAWTTIAWVAQGTVLMWLSFRLRIGQFRIWSYVVFGIVFVRLLFFDTTVDTRTFTPVINERFLAFIVGIAAMYLTSYLLWRQRESLAEQEGKAWSVYPVFLVVANFLTVWLLSAELWGHFSKQLVTLTGEEYRTMSSALLNSRNLSLTVLWAVYAIAVMAIGIVRRSRLVRLVGLGLLAVPIVKLFAYDVFALEQMYRIIAFIGLGVLLLIGAYLYQRYSEAIKGFLVKE